MEIVESVRRLYGQGLAVREIASRLGISTNRIYKLMKKHRLQRRSVAEANRLSYLRKEPSFKSVFIENQEQEILKTAGTMLYWAEGTKTGNTVDFANSDKKMIRIFMKFLRDICRIDESKLRIYLYCYPQHDADFLINYWALLTDVPKNRFIKPYIRRDATGKVGRKMKYGMIHVRYHDKKLMVQFLKWVAEYCGKLLEGFPSGQRG